MKTRFNSIKIVLAIIISAILIIAVLIVFYLFDRPVPKKISSLNNDFQNEVSDSIDRFYQRNDFVDIITGVETDADILSISFAGMTDPDTMNSVIEIVKQYGIKCAFFLEGAEVAEYSRVVDAIFDSGNEIGSYTLYGNKHINKNLTYDVIEDFVYSSELIGRAAGVRPAYLMCNNSLYTNNLLKAAFASGYDFIVDPTHILNFQSFSTYDMAYNYVHRLPRGSVITIKMKGVLDDEEYVYPEKEQDVGKEAGIAKNNPAQLLNEKERLLNVIEWVCKSIYITKRNTVMLSSLSDLPPSNTQYAQQENSTEDETAVAAATQDAPAENSSRPKSKTTVAKVSTSKQETLSGSYGFGISEEEQLRLLKRKALLRIVDELIIENGDRMKEPIKLKTAEGRAFNYIFYGVANEVALNDELSRLAKLKTSAMFFVAEEDMIQYPDRVKSIIEAGHNIGIALLSKNSENFTEASVSLLSAYNTLVKSFDIKSTYVLVPFGSISNDIKKAVSTCRMNIVSFDIALVRSAERYETSADKVISKVIGNTMSNLKNGSTVYFRMDYYESSDYLVGDLVDAIGLHDSTLMQLANLRNINNAQLAEPIKMVYTSERALSFIFYGIENQTALYDTLRRLDDMDCKGTFFVSMTDILDYPKSIGDIAIRGHEIGVGILPARDEDFFTVGVTIKEVRDILLQQYGINTSLVMTPYGTVSNVTREAISVLDMTMIEPSVWIVRNIDEFETSADEVMNGIITSDDQTLRRGDIAYFRLDYYKNSDTLVGELVRAIKEKLVDSIRYAYDDLGASAYEVKSVGSLLNKNKDLLYQYPVPIDKMPAGVANAIYPGHLENMSEDKIFNEMVKRYIGNPDITGPQLLPGFTEKQISRIDKVGKINTGGKKTIFLTFDDWSTDYDGNKLLYVLEKHNVKASFFIRTNYVNSNPNLLRAIAAQGHDIGSHTVNHMALAHPEPEEDTYTVLSDYEVETLKKELVESYNTLVDIAGDILNEKGQPVVKPYFRAPTLAQSYIGMKTVLDTGYRYTINGDFSSGDYNAENVDDVMDILNNGVTLYDGSRRTMGAGSIVVMHISPSARFTPEALDLFLTENENKPADERFHFARLSDYLQ